MSGTLTSCTVRTASSGARVEMNSTGIRGYASGGGVTWYADAAGASFDSLSGTSLAGYGLAIGNNGISKGWTASEIGVNDDVNMGVKKLYCGGVVVSSNQVLGARGATIADPSGGGTQDAEARAAINAIIDRLQAHGLIS